jgi:hypothetical protein
MKHVPSDSRAGLDDEFQAALAGPGGPDVAWAIVLGAAGSVEPRQPASPAGDAQIAEPAEAGEAAR